MKTVIKIVSIVTLCLASSGAGAQTNTKVIGKLKDLKAGTTIYLRSLLSPVRKDSVVAGKGRFEFNLALEEGNYYELKIEKPPLGRRTATRDFYLEPGVVKIKGKTTDMASAKFSGSKFIDDQNDLKNYIKNAEELKKYEQNNADYLKAYYAKDSARVAALHPKYHEWFLAYIKLYRKWVLDHPSSPVSALVLWDYVRERDKKKLQELLDHLHPEAKQNALAKDMQRQIDVSKAIAVGKPAPDFVQNDTAGKPVALKDFRGKYVLIDFWASWCGPCRLKSPELVKAYNNYKDKNFTILSVSLDQPGAKDKWLKAIHDDKLTWTHVSDLKFWDNEVAKLYGIKSVPATLLIGPDGVILARGGNLEENLRKFIK